MATVSAYVDVEVDLDDFVTDDLIEELEDRGFIVMDKDDSDGPEHLKDNIHRLKEDFIEWYQFGMKNENFENRLKEFFKETINEYIQ